MVFPRVDFDSSWTGSRGETMSIIPSGRAARMLSGRSSINTTKGSSPCSNLIELKFTEAEVCLPHTWIKREFLFHKAVLAFSLQKPPERTAQPVGGRRNKGPREGNVKRYVMSSRRCIGRECKAGINNFYGVDL